MNPRNNKAEWFCYAKMYARAARFLMEKTPPVHNTICYLSFLSAECSMKGFLLQNHLHPVPDTHDLRELCQLCASFQAGYLELEDDCDFLTQFATPSGFPSFERATQEDAEQALDTLQGILEFGQSQKQSQGPTMTM